MAKLVCDFQTDPNHPNRSADVPVDAKSFAVVKKTVEDHLAAVPAHAIYGALGQAGTKWHIEPQGQDWHIIPD
jgi:hypothetical protein